MSASPDLEKLRTFYADAPDDVSLDALDLGRLPRHISIIMDGNGRWATARGLDRSKGHAAGVDSLRETITASVRLGIECLSAYAFSTENWKRPRHEVELLMRLFSKTLAKEMPLFHQEHVRLKIIGDMDGLPKSLRASFERAMEETASYDVMTLALAVNYGARDELTHAMRAIVSEVQAASLDPESIDEDTLAAHLYTAGLPDPELLVRTSGELRLSNFLLWQLAYTEFYISPLMWPDFDRWELLRAIYSFQSRDRRFGGVK
ncbi:MAG: isoprenyl transferase [Atopobiaceae bacterium]|nr:isoprenyl transferase [Atopobiaceae bacterium]